MLISHDVYKWINPKSKSKGKEKRVKKHVVLFNQATAQNLFSNILKKLLKARKDTRKKIKFITVNYYDEDGNEQNYSGLIDKNGENVIIKDKEISKDKIISMKDTYNDFEKSVYDGLQLAFKVTANSLYGQIGATTSSIYLKDIAASTTAVGRMLLHLARDKTKEYFKTADIVYGDTEVSLLISILLIKMVKRKGSIINR